MFASLGMGAAIFVLSTWIINDQVEKAFMSLDADRLRRTFDDLWLIRILYPMPALPFRTFMAAYGARLLAAWLCAIWYVWRKGLLRVRPEEPSLLRNMVYFRKLRQ